MFRVVEHPWSLWRHSLKELAEYLLQNVILDFDGEVTVEAVRAFLREDNSAGSRAMMQKIIEDNGVDDLLLALADVLVANLTSGINADVIAEHIATYTES
jgi:hypothetical protein